jgi:methyl-accepting chemotaxis protein
MTIANKLLLAVAMTSVIALICILGPPITAYGLKGTSTKVTTYEILQEEISLTQDLQLQVANVWQFITDASLTRDKEVIEKEAKPAYEKSQQIITKLLELNKSDRDRAAGLRAIQAALPIMWQTGTKMFADYGISFEAGNSAMEMYDKACDQVIKDAAEIAAKSKQDGRQQIKQVSGELSLLSKLLMAGGWGTGIIGVSVLFMMFFLRRSIVTALKQIEDEVGFLAKGDLSRQFDQSGKDEIAHVSKMLNHLVAELHTVISRISGTSTQVAAASNSLNSTAEIIATGTEELAIQSASVATAGEEMSATAGSIAQNCQMAAEGAECASRAASNGAEVVERTVAVMGQITEKVQDSARTVASLGARSDQIGAIIGTIEDIADQTNLLALNAAIEAARAGEQGRGFAVVADEVRALAERTTRATKEIGAMIKAIQNETRNAVLAMEQGVVQVENGTVEAAKSGQALQNIMQLINDVAMQINQIATAAEEQTAITDEIAGNMQLITHVGQKTSQGAQESATMAAQLYVNAEELQRLVQQFAL